MSLIFIIPWGIAAGVAYYFMETNGSKLKKYSPAEYDKIANDKDGSEAKKLKAELPEKIKLRDSSKTKLDELKKKLADDPEASDVEDTKTRIKTLEEALEKQEAAIFIAENADKSLWMPVLSISNIAWTAGIFFGAGIILHYITKKVMSIGSKESSN